MIYNDVICDDDIDINKTQYFNLIDIKHYIIFIFLSFYELYTITVIPTRLLPTILG